MTAPEPTHRCPACQGERMRRDPTGLRFSHTNGCALRAREDSRRLADGDLVGPGRARAVGFVDPHRRPLTETEATLLAVCGVDPGDVVDVVVDRYSRGGAVVRRDFRMRDGTLLDLDSSTPEPTTDPNPTTKD